ncbi:restriction endonuclease subunit S [Escherichia fergusonii]|uniref:restriction endonuclease subunit S n=1 Tax=Escherichia fergusonii TaxID=564 RepID=UPI000F67CFE1|nr:restriction endonuclease subunit S [Escherichia fergusonii]EJB0945800.1 restriction endonuclease subunit S [Escherichia fergusonii]QMA57973.1 restriction endonuclease subunit S [Escherichia fergusonii]QMA80453.1 restriction endonuclease subunit S [Escherichia fergusonii]QMA93913.1 restriction endonuclease subunit S [Escherichia fergusonii]QMC75299.1 restriction endonuclease subunit S [Escherichia fergusonii]
MSELSYLEKLLDGVEVEWLPLAKVCRLINGRAYKQEELLSKGKYPVLRVGNFFTNQNWYYSDLELDQDKYCDNGDLLYAWSASFGPRIWHGGKSIYHYHIWKVVPDSNLICKQFLYYLLQWDTKALKDAHSTGSTMMHISKTTIEKRLVPIPCPDNPEKSLAIQSEIVRILDKFTAVTAELTAELNMRKKQYNYYRDQLLSFKEGEVEWKTLGEVAVIGTGNHDTQDAIEHGKYIFYARGREPLKLNVFDFDETAIITAGDGAGVGKVFHYAKGKYALHQRAYRIVPNAFMNPRFVYHYITAYFFTYIQKASVSSSVTSLRRPMFLKFPIPVPPSEEQAHIVEILDKFDTLTNSITEGLPREIELRQKQYEYYRDLLFSFPKPETVSN